jgi:CDP-diacylglycerol--glycerol-3-phosphate 3-phosphatidyltransferase
MLSLSNSLSFLRAPLAFLFLIDNMPCRLIAIFLAMLTDSIDGYLARKRQTTTQFGAILDPAMDKFFVFFALAILLAEKKLAPWQGCSMVARDFALCLFGLYVSLAGQWHAYECKALRWGKISTALQFLVLISLTLGYSSPNYLYVIFILFGVLAFIELFGMKKSSVPVKGEE